MSVTILDISKQTAVRWFIKSVDNEMLSCENPIGPLKYNQLGKKVYAYGLSEWSIKRQQFGTEMTWLTETTSMPGHGKIFTRLEDAVRYVERNVRKL